MAEVMKTKHFPIIAVVMIVIGVAFIFNIKVGFENILGPLITLGFGVGMLIRYVMGDKEGSKPPFIGIILTTVGAVLLINQLKQDLDLGSLFMLVIGLMMVVRYAISKTERSRFPMVGLLLAVIGALLLLRSNPSYYWVLPLLLVIGGILLIGRWHWSKEELNEGG